MDISDVRGWYDNNAKTLRVFDKSLNKERFLSPDSEEDLRTELYISEQLRTAVYKMHDRLMSLFILSQRTHAQAKLLVAAACQCIYDDMNGENVYFHRYPYLRSVPDAENHDQYHQVFRVGHYHILPNRRLGITTDGQVVFMHDRSQNPYVSSYFAEPIEIWQLDAILQERGLEYPIKLIKTLKDVY